MNASAKENGVSPDGNLDKIAVFERHKATGKIGSAPSQVSGFKRRHRILFHCFNDSHNIIVIGDNDADIPKARWKN